MKTVLKLLIIMLLFCSFNRSNGQNKAVDSLKSILNTEIHDTTRLSVLDALAKAETDPKLSAAYDEQIENLANKILEADPSLLIKNTCKKFLANAIQRKGTFYMAQVDYTKALEYYTNCLKIREEIKDKIGISKLFNNIGVIYYNQGDIPKAFEYHNKSLKIREEIKDKIGISASLNNIGLIYYNQGNIAKVLDYFNKSLKIQEELGDKSGISKLLSNIGVIYKDQGNIPKAFEYHNKSLKIREEIEDKSGISASLNNIGMIYLNQDDFPKALDYFNKSLKIQEELGDKSVICSLLNNIGLIYSNMADIPKALEYFNKSLRIKEEIGDKKGVYMSLINIGMIYSRQGNILKALDYFNKGLKICEDLGNKSGIYTSLSNIGMIYMNQDNIPKAFDYAVRAYKLAKETGYVKDIESAASFLEKIYAKKGNYKLSRQYYGEYIAMHDSLNNEENQKLIQHKYFQYQYEKQAATDSIAHSKAMEIKNLEIARQKAENRKQQIIIFSSTGGFLIVLVFSLIILRMFRRKREANILLALQNEEIMQQKEEITAQRDEIEAQRDLVVMQKEHIEEQKKGITDSINYARRIQQAVLPSGDSANMIFGDHFILFKPKDIVSGDFYWGARINELLIVTVADCTGHGVPGAFMSMLGVSFLNEIVRKKEIIKASDILDHLRDSIIEALQQKGYSGEQKDGMDIALCVLNTANLQLQFAGANNSLIIVNAQMELKEIKPDKQPVAIHIKMNPFSNHEIQLSKGDCIYLSSDGYGDQFGGSDSTKFKTKQLKELFVSISDKPMHEQREILDATFENWKGELEQIDDVTILGLRI